MIKYANDGRGVARITFNRDDKRNAVNQAMAEQLLEALDRSQRQGARVVVVRANPGVAVWCAGHDLSELNPQTLHTSNPTLDIIAKIRDLDLPVIAMVEGAVYAGGMLILLSADLVVATETSEVAMTSNKMGLPLNPELYAFWLSVMGLHRAKELLFTAAPMSAQDARQAGLFNHVVRREQLEQVTEQLAQRVMECSAVGLANTKRQLNLIASQSGLNAASLSEIQQRNAEILNSPETKARIGALLESLRRR